MHDTKSKKVICVVLSCREPKMKHAWFIYLEARDLVSALVTCYAKKENK